MRKLIYAINITADGCVDHTKQRVDNESPEFLEFFTQLLRDVDAEVFGRKTYELMVPYWPDVAKNPSSSPEDVEFAEAFVALKKVVFSRSLDPADDGNTRIVNSDLRDEILKLKREEGKDILVGGVEIPSQLIELGLIDEFILVVAPTIVGEGRRLFETVSLPESLQLKLVDSKVFESGRIALRYGVNSRQKRRNLRMNVKEQIKNYIADQPEPKRAELLELHGLVTQVSPNCKLWFLDGKDASGKVVSNPNIGYGLRTMKYADGSTRDFYRVGLSANKSGISVYILGIEDKKYLAGHYGKDLGKASVTGYCIRFKTLRDINVSMLESAIRFGFENPN